MCCGATCVCAFGGQRLRDVGQSVTHTRCRMVWNTVFLGEQRTHTHKFGSPNKCYRAAFVRCVWGVCVCVAFERSSPPSSARRRLLLPTRDSRESPECVCVGLCALVALPISSNDLTTRLTASGQQTRTNVRLQPSRAGRLRHPLDLTHCDSLIFALNATQLKHAKIDSGLVKPMTRAGILIIFCTSINESHTTRPLYWNTTIRMY
jgi:hypothetical protein